MNDKVSIAGVKLLIPDPTTLEVILKKYREDPKAYMNAESEEQLIAAIAGYEWIWFQLEAEDLLVGFQVVTPWQAFLHVIGFADSKLTKSTVSRFNELITEVMLRSGWERISAMNPSDSSQALGKILLLIGFKFEGLLRRSIHRKDTFADSKLYGLIMSDLPKQVIPEAEVVYGN